MVEDWSTGKLEEWNIGLNAEMDCRTRFPGGERDQYRVLAAEAVSTGALSSGFTLSSTARIFPIILSKIILINSPSEPPVVTLWRKIFSLFQCLK